MTVLLVLLTFVVFLVIDWCMPKEASKTFVLRGTQYTTPGFEMLGALAQDGGEKYEEKKK